MNPAERTAAAINIRGYCNDPAMYNPPRPEEVAELHAAAHDALDMWDNLYGSNCDKELDAEEFAAFDRLRAILIPTWSAGLEA